MKRKTKKRSQPETVRGVSYANYQAYARLVRLGKTTWRKLERAGHVEPVARTEAYRNVVVAK